MPVVFNDTVAHDKLQDAIDQLYGASLDAFVSERKRLAGELKKEGDPEAAEQLAKLPKPTAAAWALNNVAREDPAAVEQWLEATSALRSATEDPGRVGGDALRAAMGAQRAATGQLIDVVRDRAQPGGRPLSPAMVDRVRGLLHAATADQAVAERLKAGRMTEEKELDAPTPVPSGKRPASRAPSKVTEKPSKVRQKPSKPSESDPEAAARSARRADLRRQVTTAREQLRRTRREASRTETAARAAEERREDAQRALRRSESEAGAARESATEASAAADVAEQELERLEALLRN